MGINGASKSGGVRNAGPRRPFAIWPRIAAGFGLAAFLVIGCGGWAVMAHLDGAVITSGVVKVDQNLKEVQHRDEAAENAARLQKRAGV